MSAISLRARSFLASALTLLVAAPIFAGDAREETIKDRKQYIPSRKHVEVPGKIIGVLLFDGQPVLSTEGRSGPPDQLVFSEGGNSYRWVYVPAVDMPMITNLQVPTGPKGEVNIYPALNMASPRTVTPWGITKPYTLVEVSVNHEKGSPSNDSFVGTNFKVLDGTKEFPLKTTDAIEQVKYDYAKYQKTNEKALEGAMEKARLKALKERKATGPREKQDLMYVTWLGKEEVLEVRFRTRLTDGAYTIVEGGGFRPFDPPPLPLPPVKGRPVPPKAIPLPGNADFPVAFPPPPPPRFQVKIGTSYGIEYGRAYQVDRNGKVIRSLQLSVEDFVQELQPPPGGIPLERPLPLPLPPAPKERE